MKPPKLPESILHPGLIDSLFGSKQQATLGMQRAAQKVLKNLGATDAQLHHLADKLPLKNFCTLFCRTETVDAPIRVLHSDAETAFMISERIDCDSVVQIAGVLAQAGMASCAIGLMTAALQAQNGLLGDQQLLLGAITGLLKNQPEMKVPPQAAETLKKFIRDPHVAKLISEETCQVLEAALKSSDQNEAVMSLAPAVAEIAQQVAELRDGEGIPTALIDSLVSLHAQSFELGEFSYSRYAIDTLTALMSRTRDLRIAMALDTCQSMETSNAGETAYEVAKAHLPRIGFVDGELTITEPDKPCNPALVFNYLQESVKMPGAIHLDVLRAHIAYGAKQRSEDAQSGPHPFTRTAVRELLVRFAQTDGLASLEDADKIVADWIRTLTLPGPVPEGEDAVAPDPPTNIEVAAILSSLGSLAPADALRLTSEIAVAVKSASTPDEQGRFPGDAALLSTRVQSAARTGDLDAALIASVLEHEAAADLSGASQSVLLEALLKLPLEALTRLGPEYSRLFFEVRKGDGAGAQDAAPVSNRLTCTLKALIASANEAPFDDVIAELQRHRNARTPDGKHAAQLTAALIGSLMKRELTAQQMTTLASILECTSVRDEGQLAYSGMMEAFCLLAESPEGRNSLQRLRRVLEPYVCDFHNMVILTVEQRQSSYMTAAACCAALYASDPRGTSLPARRTPIAAYFGLCLYSHDLLHLKTSAFDRDSERYLIWAIHRSGRASVISEESYHQMRAWQQMAKAHLNDGGDAGRNAADFLRLSGAFVSFSVPDRWADEEIQRCFRAVRLAWDQGQLNRELELDDDRNFTPKTEKARGIRTAIMYA